MSHNFAPHDANVALLLVVAALVGSASTENEGNALAHVEFSVGLGVNTFELQQRNIVVLSGQAPLVASNFSLGVQSNGLMRGHYASLDYVDFC
jgi:hypothetical protein